MITDKPIYIVDIETNGINATEIWVVGYAKYVRGKEPVIKCLYDKRRVVELFDTIREEGGIVMGHSFVRYDAVQLRNVWGIPINYKIWDSLAICYYLYSENVRNGLAFWGDYFQFPKVVVEDHEWLTFNKKLFTDRVSEDVRIGYLLMGKILDDMEALYEGDGDKIQSVFNFVSHLMNVIRYQEDNGIKLDMEKLNNNLEMFETERDRKKEILKAAMPPVKKYRLKSKPKVLYKKDESLSKQGEQWFNLLIEHGLPDDYEGEIKILSKIEEANPNSVMQVKEWLYSLGWVPETFAYTRDKKTNETKKIEQIRTPDKQLCPSVLVLAEQHESIKELDDYTVLGHRAAILKGFLKIQKDGIITASISGLAATLRMKHKNVVNLPGVTDKGDFRDGVYIRECLVPREGNIFVAADISGLEDNSKQHFIYPYDPDYVNEMQAENFDPHINIGVFAGLITKEDGEFFKRIKKDVENELPVSKEDMNRYKKIGKERKKAKVTNFSSTYSIGADALARQLKIKKKEAKKLIDAFWSINWSVKKFTEDATVKYCNGKDWIYQPLNGYWYESRNKFSRFSQLNQGGGSVLFNYWVWYILQEDTSICLSMHDEVCLETPDTPEDIARVTRILKESMEKVNKMMNLNVTLKIDVQRGYSYADVH